MYLLVSKFPFLEFRLLLSRVAPYLQFAHELFEMLRKKMLYFKAWTTKNNFTKFKKMGHFSS